MNEEVINSDVAKVKPSRNYSFKTKDEQGFDSFEDGEKIFIIPAQPGSCYWAILRVAYENHDQPMRKKFFIDEVAKLLEDRDPEKWQKFVGKSKVKTFKNNEVVEKTATDYRARIETNIKTMCRHSGSNPYGQRICERGHILRWEYNAFDGEGGYCLRTDTNQPLVKPKKAAKEVNAEIA